MAKYFHYSQGLRGCYMPDSSSVLMCRTRRELRNALEWDAEHIRDAGNVGLSKKNIAAFAALLWKEAQKDKPAYLPYALPYADQSRRPYNYAFGLFLSVATRRDYLDYCKEESI
jgi:hypothetical protein